MTIYPLQLQSYHRAAVYENTQVILNKLAS